MQTSSVITDCDRGGRHVMGILFQFDVYSLVCLSRLGPAAFQAVLHTSFTRLFFKIKNATKDESQTQPCILNSASIQWNVVISSIHSTSL